MLQDFFAPFLELLFPSFCVSCHRLFTVMCPRCLNDLSFYTFPITLELQPCYLDSLIAATEYAPPISQLIHSLKYQHAKNIAPFLGELLYNTTNFPDTEGVTAVPLHPQRQAERGFNQAEEIARTFSAHAHIPYCRLLKRVKHTKTQASIEHRPDRLNNLAQVFGLNPLLTPEQLPHSVLIIDDVATTGTTLNECAKILKQSGVQVVHGLVVAHGQ